MKLKNIAEGGRGFGVAGVAGGIEFAAGEIKDVSDDIVARAKKDPTNSGMFAEGGCFVEVTGTAAKVPAEDEARLKAEAEAKAKQDAEDEAARKAAEDAAAQADGKGGKHKGAGK